MESRNFRRLDKGSLASNLHVQHSNLMALLWQFIVGSSQDIISCIQSILLVLLHCLVMRFTSHSRLSHHGRAHTYRHTHRHTHTHTFSHKPTHLSQIAKSQRPPDQVAVLPPPFFRVPDGHPEVWHGRSRSKEDASSEVAVAYQNGMSNR